MKLALGYYEWTAIRGLYVNGSALPGAIEDLYSATVRSDAELAVRRIEEVCPLDSELSEASVALASCLVNAIWGRPECSLDLIVGILSDIAAGLGEDCDGDDLSEIHARCLREICRGFPMYVELLESHYVPDVRTACVDLISACGLFDKSLTGRAIWFLEASKKLKGMEGFHSLIDSSIDDLR
ncbi:hypothetical protein [Amycolatopsis keratiniphila]|uniref:hypothetical protein n=1 Tax=Amycolatopsis keratiniphila TaxID=129921 RepID=UPI001178931C|nr:hypothetical protein [Amycolatopsis keratiniphila]